MSYYLFLKLVIQAKESQGVWWMPWLPEAMKDVISCDKRGVGADDL